MSDRDLTNALGSALQALRVDGEDIIVAIGAIGPSADCRSGHMLATIRRGSDEGTGEAVYLDDAIRLARGELRDIARRREAEKAEAAKVEQPA